MKFRTHGVNELWWAFVAVTRDKKTFDKLFLLDAPSTKDMNNLTGRSVVICNTAIIDRESLSLEEFTLYMNQRFKAFK